MDYSLEQALNGPAGRHPFRDALMRDVATWSAPSFGGIAAVWFLHGWIRGLAHEQRGAPTARVASGGALLVKRVVTHAGPRMRPADAPAFVMRRISVGLDRVITPLHLPLPARRSVPATERKT